MKTRHLVLVATLAITTLAISTVTATAQTVRHRDKTHDVARTTPDANPELTSAPGHRNGDITWVRATYRHSALLLSMRFVMLHRAQHQQWSYFAIRTSKGLERDLLINAGRKYPHGAAALTDRKGDFVRCPVRHRISYRHDLVSVRIPARCLGRASWVRAGFGQLSMSRLASRKPLILLDDGYVSKPVNNDDDITYGPRVHRG